MNEMEGAYEGPNEPEGCKNNARHFPLSLDASRGSHTQTVPSDLDAPLRMFNTLLASQAGALAHLSSQCSYSEESKTQIRELVAILHTALALGGKIVVSGMGKSFKIACKAVATLNSLGLHAAALHPSEALHGDLGLVRADHNDAMVIISASGNSSELALMLQHVPEGVPVVLLTCTRGSVLTRNARVVAVLCGELPCHLNEKTIYGISAPTVSTTLCLAMLDALSVTLSVMAEADAEKRRACFGIRHPGGAIGQTYNLEKTTMCDTTETTASPNVSCVDAKHSTSKASNLPPPGTYITLDSLPRSEIALLRILTCYDHILLRQEASSSTYITVDTAVARSIYKDAVTGQQPQKASDSLEAPLETLEWRLRAYAAAHSVTHPKSPPEHFT